MNLTLHGPYPLIDGVTINGANQQVSTMTETATLRPLIGVYGASAIIVRLWDAQAGGTPKGITQFNTEARIAQAGTGWSENAYNVFPYTSNAAQLQLAGGYRGGAVLNVGAAIATAPVNNSGSGYGVVVSFDDFALRLVSDATTNPMVLWAVGYILRGDVVRSPA